MTTLSFRYAGRLATILAVLGMLAPMAFVPPAIATAQSDPRWELYYSEQTGYYFFWDPATWSIETESSQPGFDSIRLVDGEEGLFDLSAFLAPGVTPTECLRTALDDLAADPSTLEMESLTAEELLPQVGRGSVELVLTAANGDERVTFAVFLECGDIVPGESLRLKSLVVPARVYNERGWPLRFLDPDLRVFESLTRQENAGHSHAVSGENGAVMGTLTAAGSCGSPLNAFVRAENLDGGGNFVIDPSAFLALDAEGTPLPTSLAISFPESPPGSLLVLPPGEFALFHIVADTDYFDLYYAPNVRQVIHVGAIFSSCGAGAAAPVPIDID